MGRRKSDKFTSRAVIGLAVLACLTGLLAAVIGYRALTALDVFINSIQTMSRQREENRPLPWPLGL